MEQKYETTERKRDIGDQLDLKSLQSKRLSHGRFPHTPTQSHAIHPAPLRLMDISLKKQKQKAAEIKVPPQSSNGLLY